MFSADGRIWNQTSRKIFMKVLLLKEWPFAPYALKQLQYSGYILIPELDIELKKIWNANSWGGNFEATFCSDEL